MVESVGYPERQWNEMFPEFFFPSLQDDTG